MCSKPSTSNNFNFERKNKMKKSTFIKVLCLALVSLFAFSLVACGGAGTGNNNANKIAIYLDPNGGTLDGDDVIYVNEGEAIGKLPTPTRGGYDFLGWFEDGNERWEVDRRTKAEYEMEIVALWEAKGDLVTVEFTTGPDEELNGDVSYIEVVEGERINSVLSKLPTATRPDYKFKGWKDASGNTVTVTSKVERDLVLSPIWEKIVYCLDNTENHAWNAWQEATEATCTTAAQSSRVCGVCGHIEYNVTQEALGHKFGNWAITSTENGLVRARVCVECDDKEADPLDNIAYEKFNTPVVDGDLWGDAPGPNLFDNDYEMNNKKSFAGKGTGAIVVTTTAKEATYVDIVAVTGYGSAPYNVVVTYADGTQRDLGLGSFGSGEGATKSFTVGAEITKIVITMSTCSIGSDYWVELSILTVPKS